MLPPPSLLYHFVKGMLLVIYSSIILQNERGEGRDGDLIVMACVMAGAVVGGGVIQAAVGVEIAVFAVYIMFPGHHVAVGSEIVAVVCLTMPACCHISVRIEIIPLIINILPTVLVILSVRSTVPPSGAVLLPPGFHRRGRSLRHGSLALWNLFLVCRIRPGIRRGIRAYPVSMKMGGMTAAVIMIAAKAAGITIVPMTAVGIGIA